jgi:hypothetical protein
VQTRHPTTVLAGRYALEEELGRSATGMVWRARDRLLGRTVAVKIIHPSLGDDPAFCDRLAGETRRVASLTAPGVARLLDSGEEEGVPFLVREHVDGESVRSLLDRTGPRPAGEAVRITVGALDALAPAHDAGVLHLHLEPDDVLVAPDGTVRVTDLGIGPAVTRTRTPAEAARLLGGDALAPEQVGEGHEEVDGRADVFAIGALLFELLAGEAPAGRRSVRGVRADVPRALDRVVSRALDPERDERFDDLRSFAAALRASDVADVVAAPRRGWMRTWLGVPIAVGVLAVTAIAAGLWLGDLEVGGPLGIRPAQDPAVARTPVRTTRELGPVGVEVADPFGDRSENASTAPLAIDGDPETAWRSEGYRYPDGGLNKPGVGLVFDLGETRRLSGFRLLTSLPGFTFHLAAGDTPEDLIPEIGEPLTATEVTDGSLSGSARYVLVWITTVVPSGDGNRAEVAEFAVTVVDGD